MARRRYYQPSRIDRHRMVSTARALAPTPGRRTRSPHARKPGREQPRRAGVMPCAKPAATAEAVVHPVPWVWRVWMRGAANASIPSAVASRSTTVSDGRWPPFSSTAGAPSASSAGAAVRMSASVAMVTPGQRLGFRQIGRDHRRHRQQPAGAGRRPPPRPANACPPFATITGSSTTGTPGALAASASQTASIVAMSPSMPILMTSAPISSITTAICWRMKSGGTGITPCTPSVFCAVSAVIAVAANASSAVTVLISAWIPAPPPESDPAMIRTRPTHQANAALFAARRDIGDHFAQLVDHVGDQYRCPRPRPSPAPAVRCRFPGSAPGRCRSAAPRPPDRGLHAALAQRRGTGEPHILQLLRQPLEYLARLPKPAVPSAPAPPAPAAPPASRRPVVAKSDRIKWPDCSPPTLMPVARICSAT